MALSSNKALRRKMTLMLLGHPATLGPVALGMGSLLYSWAAAPPGDAATFAFGGIAGVTLGVTTLALRFLYGGEKLAKKAIEELRREGEETEENQLDRLMTELRTGRIGDRGATLLRDLRELVTHFREDALWEGVESATRVDVQSDVELLFNACVERLQIAHSLGSRADRLSSEAASKPLLAKREEVLDQVEKSIEELGALLADIGTLAATAVDAADQTTLSALTGRLKRSVEARQAGMEELRQLRTPTTH